MHTEVARQTPNIEDQGEKDRFRTTVYLTEDDITSLDELKAHFRRQERRQVDRSQIIREAIRRYREALLTR